ncbi:hypothetical protein B0T13DRAFT_37301 [Neurospora crassa]|nr:hypothetical protein B0T13DRAFT_37301 [Neurospora crassa]
MCRALHCVVCLQLFRRATALTERCFESGGPESMDLIDTTFPYCTVYFVEGDRQVTPIIYPLQIVFDGWGYVKYRWRRLTAHLCGIGLVVLFD